MSCLESQMLGYFPQVVVIFQDVKIMRDGQFINVVIKVRQGIIVTDIWVAPSYQSIYPSRRHNLPPTLEIIIQNCPKFSNVNI